MSRRKRHSLQDYAGLFVTACELPFGSRDQIEAQNLFHDMMMDDGIMSTEYSQFCAKATVGEMLTEGLRLKVKQMDAEISNV